MSALARLVPAPLLSASIVALWLALSRSASAGHLVLAVLLALVVPHMTASLRVQGVRLRRPLVLVRFILRVGFDVLRSNLEVAWGVVTWRFTRPTARFVVVPLDLRDPVGLSALAMVTTVVPGTVWSELAYDRSAVLIHVWDAPDEDAFITQFKARYEAPLKEIFE